MNKVQFRSNKTQVEGEGYIHKYTYHVVEEDIPFIERFCMDSLCKLTLYTGHYFDGIIIEDTSKCDTFNNKVTHTIYELYVKVLEEKSDKQRIQRRLNRLYSQKENLERKHKGNETEYTYHAGWDLGYVLGKITILEETLDE